MKERLKNSVYIRNFVFGAEDMLVSAVGFLSGLASQGISYSTIFLTGIIYISVESFSMAVGSFLSEDSAQEYIAKSDVSDRLPIIGGIIMFFSSILAGLIPVLPYTLFSGKEAIFVSIFASMLALFLVGYTSAKFSKTNPWKKSTRMLLIGGFAIGIGVAVGSIFGI